MPLSFRARFHARPAAPSTFALALLVTALAGTARPASAAWDELESLQRTGARVSASVIDLDTGQIIQVLNADQRLAPASITKIVVSAAALDTWPIDKTWTTRVTAEGFPPGSTIPGDLTLQGAGDATLDHNQMWTLASQIRALGVTQVNGRIVVNLAPFGVLPCETDDRCQAQNGKSKSSYDAPISMLGIDYGNWCVDLRPTQAGSGGIITGCGLPTPPFTVQGGIRTVAAGGKLAYGIQRTSGAGGDVVHVTGTVPEGTVVEDYKSQSNPAVGAGLTLQAMLESLGVRVNGGVAVQSGGYPTPGITLAQVEGANLREQLGRMMRHSNNYIADVLTMNIAASGGGPAPATLASAARTLSAFVQRLAPPGAQAASNPPALYSGSGLTPENQISAEDMTGLLAAEYRNPRNFPAFYGLLSVPRQGPYAFLRSGSADWLDRVTLKTGTMSQPYSVCAIAGYMRKKSGGLMAFTTIVNGGPGLREVAHYKAMEAIKGDLDALMARY